MNYLELPAKVEHTPAEEGKLPEVHISGYTGAAVDLSDYGVDAPVVYVTNGISFKPKIPYLFNHWQPIGHATDIKIINHQLSAKGVHSHPGEQSRQIAQAIANGMPYQASMGLRIVEDSVTYHSEGTVVVNGKEMQAPIYVVNKSELVELTAALFGRDGDTEITPLSKETLMLVKNAKGSGVTTNTVPNPPSTPESPTPTPTPEPSPTPVPKEPENSVKIGVVEYAQLAAKYPSYLDIIANAIEAGKDRAGVEDAIKLHKLENSYPKMPGTHLPNTKVDNAFMARLALSCNVSPEFVKNQVGEQATDVAFQEGQMGLKEMLMYVANANGGNFNGHSDVEPMCKFIKQKVNNMEWSTIDFPNLMNRVSQWRLEEAWKLDPAWVPGKLYETSQKDHRPTGRIRPQGGEMWKKLDKDGKIQHGSFGEEVTYMTTLETSAQLLTFKREDILADDIGLINEMLDLMVEGATMIPDFQFVNTIYNGISNGFLVDGRSLFDLEFSIENLRTVFNAIRTYSIQKGDKSVKNFFNTKWRIVHTTALEEEVWEVLNQQRLIAGVNAVQGDKNFWYGRLDQSHFPHLDNPSYHEAADARAWGLMPVRQQLSPYTVTYLNGRKKPTTETIELPGDMLGFGVRGYWDVKVQEREPLTVAWSFPSLAASSAS